MNPLYCRTSVVPETFPHLKWKNCAFKIIRLPSKSAADKNKITGNWCANETRSNSRPFSLTSPENIFAKGPVLSWAESSVHLCTLMLFIHLIDPYYEKTIQF